MRASLLLSQWLVTKVFPYSYRVACNHLQFNVKVTSVFGDKNVYSKELGSYPKCASDPKVVESTKLSNYVIYTVDCKSHLPGQLRLCVCSRLQGSLQLKLTWSQCCAMVTVTPIHTLWSPGASKHLQQQHR
jgi:hypothetical protein